MGIPALLVDRHARVGNSWRNRYKSVMLNTPTFTDHYPFLEYPESWPRWLSRDAVADFMEHYAQIVGLDVQTNTDGTSIERDEQRGSRVRSRNPTAHAPFVRSMWFLPRESSTTSLSSPSSPARSSSRARSTTPASTHRPRWYPTFRTKKIVVIGPGTSGHDVAQDFVNHGRRQGRHHDPAAPHLLALRGGVGDTPAGHLEQGGHHDGGG